MNPLSFVYPLMALIAGALFPMQASLNAQLGRGIGGPIAATMISFAVGLASMVLVNLVVFRQFPDFAEIAGQPLHLLLVGGALGAAYVSINVFLAPRIGAAVLLCFVIAGQLVGALAIDRLGLFGLVVRELSIGRLAGVALVLVGALMVRLA